VLIACLGWGSLVWDPRDLPVQCQPNRWFRDGPFLPIEFTRFSSNGRVTLVITAGSDPVRSLWSPLRLTNLDDARSALGWRECRKKADPKECVGYWPGGPGEADITRPIGEWAKGLAIDAVVWTCLPPKSDRGERDKPGEDEVISRLKKLGYVNGKAAECYIRMTPRQIDTAYRRRIERELGWTPSAEAQ